jgi:DNA-binding NarL/FixJ family response regulator
MKLGAKVLIRVAVVESDPLRFLGFRTILSSEPELQVRAASIDSILKSSDYDVVLMTINQGAVFHAAMSTLQTCDHSARILVAGPAGRDDDILLAISYGAKGYIAEDAPPDQFVQAIRVLHKGSVWLPGRVLAQFIERVTGQPRKILPPGSGAISQREREVLRLLIAGRSNREIGKELGIMERTVKAHVSQLMRKVGVQNRISLSVHAVTHALFPS